jgi:hypothetical protein
MSASLKSYHLHEMPVIAVVHAAHPIESPSASLTDCSGASTPTMRGAAWSYPASQL